MKELLIPGVSAFGSLLLFTGVLVTAFLGRKRKPTEVTDLWDENRKLNDDLAELRGEFNTYRENKDREFADYKKDQEDKMSARDKERRILRHVVATIGDGFDAAWSYITILKATMADSGIVVPEPNMYVKAATDAARDVRAQTKDLESA